MTILSLEQFIQHNNSIINKPLIKKYDNNNNTTHLVSFVINNEQEELNLKTEFIKLTSCGVPRLIDEFYNGYGLCYINIPLDPLQKECQNLEKVLNILDNWGRSMAEQLFGANHKNFEYNSCIRKYNTKTGIEIKNVKIKLRTNANKDDIITKFVCENEPNKPVDMKLKNMAEVLKNIPYMSDVKFIFKVSKFWAIMPKKNSKGIYGLGLLFNIIKYNSNIKNNMKKDNCNFDEECPIIFNQNNSSKEEKIETEF